MGNAVVGALIEHCKQNGRSTLVALVASNSMLKSLLFPRPVLTSRRRRPRGNITRLEEHTPMSSVPFFEVGSISTHCSNGACSFPPENYAHVMKFPQSREEARLNKPRRSCLFPRRNSKYAAQNVRCGVVTCVVCCPSSSSLRLHELVTLRRFVGERRLNVEI
jgi:hypothetical protein